MQTREQWLTTQIKGYEVNPYGTVEEMLLDTIQTIQQYLNNPDREVNKGLLKDCCEYYSLFLEEIGLLTPNQ